MSWFFSKFKHLDLPLIISSLVLAFVGLAFLYSTSVSQGSTSLFWRQVAFVVGGVVLFFFFTLFDYHTLAKANKIIYPFFLLLLIYVLVFGSIVHGGKRWINLVSLGVQPAEFIKLVVILGLARLLYLRRGQINSWGNLAWSFFYAAIPAVLVLLEPDLGSALVIMGLWLTIILVSPIKRKFVISMLILAAVLGGVGWKFYLKSFQKDRIVVFLNPSLDPKGRGYNVRQATIAVGSGQLVGQGLGQGLQSQQKFLPEQQTDFIFAASAEQVGFLGSLALIGLYFFIALRLLIISKKARDDLGMYIAVGVFFFIFLHVVINIGMNIGLLPVTGIPLPLLSAGGSSVIATFIALGIAQNIAIQSKVLRF